MNMSGIPPIVPKTLRDEVYKIQDQLKILINNYKVRHPGSILGLG